MKKFKYLPKEVKLLLVFNQWIMYTLKSEIINVDYYDNFKHLRHWCVDVILDLEGFYDEIPSVNDQNQNEIFKTCKANIDLKAFKSILSPSFEIGVINSMVVPK